MWQARQEELSWKTFLTTLESLALYFYPFPVKPAHFPGCTCLPHARKEKVPCSHVEVRFCVVTALNLEKAPYPPRSQPDSISFIFN